MNHIYLDLDGVVLLEDDRRNTVISRTAVELLQVLRRDVQAEIWIISSRRNTTPWPQLCIDLDAAGIGGVHCAPLRHAQAQAVRLLLHEHKPEQWIIIDDDPHRYTGQPDLQARLVVPSNRFGLLEQGYHQARRLFGLADLEATIEFNDNDL